MQLALNLLTEMHAKVIYKETACSEMDVWTKSHYPVHCQVSLVPFALSTKNKIRKKSSDSGEQNEISFQLDRIIIPQDVSA